MRFDAALTVPYILDIHTHTCIGISCCIYTYMHVCVWRFCECTFGFLENGMSVCECADYILNIEMHNIVAAKNAQHSSYESAMSNGLHSWHRAVQ